MADQTFVDSSVLVALIAKESGWEEHSDAIKSASRCFTSPLAVLETVMALSSIMRSPPAATERVVRNVLSSQDIRMLSISDQTASAAIRAFERYGKGRHPARLNLGDCISYACAQENGLKLLYKGDDFARTDLG